MADVWANSMACHPERRITLQGAATWRIHCHDCATYVTLQGAVTWRNQCRDRATLQGVRIPSAILKICFSPYFIIFLFLMQFRLWRAAAFVSSPIDLLNENCVKNSLLQCVNEILLPVCSETVHLVTHCLSLIRCSNAHVWTSAFYFVL